MFIAEALGRQEVERGRPLVGPSGSDVNTLIREHNDFARTDVYVTNIVKCRPIEYDGNDPIIQWNGDYKNCPPSPGQIRECTKRYLEAELEAFEGDTIIGLGNVPLRYFAGQNVTIGKHFSSLYEFAEMADCPKCEGNGEVEQSRRRCPACKGKGYNLDRVFPPFYRCRYHPEYTGKVRKAARCTACDALYMQKHPVCDECNGEKMFPRPPKPCPRCGGDGKVAADPKKPYVSTRLRPGQIFYPLFHPSYLMRNNKMKSQQIAAWKRIEVLHAEARASNDGVDYRMPTDSADDVPLSEQRLSVDIETTTLDPLEEGAAIRCVSLSPNSGRSVVFSPDSERMRDLLRRRTWIGQNVTLFDAWYIYHQWGIIPSAIRDTRFMAHLLNPDTPNDLTSIAREFADPPMQGYWKAAKDYRDNIYRVCALDTDATIRAYAGLERQLAETSQINIFENDIVPLCSTVLDMRIRGMRVDKEKMRTMATAYEAQIAELRAGLPEGINTENQTAKLKEWLKGLGLKLPRKKNKETLDKEALKKLDERLRLHHSTTEKLTDGARRDALGVIERVRSLRGMSKLVSSFLRQGLDDAGYVHPVLNPGGTATLRLSCSNPNAQQIPQGARGIFIPDSPDQVVISADLKQAEVIGLLVLAEEWEVLCRVLGGEDVHGIVASMIFGGGYTKEQRTAAKTTTFAILYGEAPETTAVRLGISLKECNDLRTKYFQALPGVAEYRSTMIRESQQLGYVTNPFGYRRYIRVPDGKTWGREVNQACNAPIQNICPMVTRRAMNDLHGALTNIDDSARLWMQVHDEVLIIGESSHQAELIELIREVMSQGIPELRVPASVSGDGILHFPVDIAVGPNWAEVEDIA
jgi:uracil-DNA glycosylase family 4